MSMFKTTDAKTPDEYIEKIEEPRRSEIKQLNELIKKTVPDLEPRIEYGMIGYGTFHYKYASGREGNASLIALASQKNYISVYVLAVKEGQYLAESYRDQLPKANIGKSCIRFKKIEDIDLDVLQEVIREAEKLGGAGAV
jgi:uncharacterized protein YdhG (YjbR/CyaY superfamily)